MSGEAGRLYGATVAKRRLSSRLTAMRKAAGLTPAEAAGKLRWDRDRLREIEANRWRLPEPASVRDLARVYGAAEQEQDELSDLALHARTWPWWRSFEDVNGSDEFPGYEADASRIRLYTPLELPELLQTGPYAEAHLAASSPWPRTWQARALRARMRRQQILIRPRTAPQLTAVITEASLAYQWGTSRERRSQILHLAAMSRQPNIDLRLLRFEDGPHPGMSSTISILDFPDEEDPGIVYLETGAGSQEVTRAHQARACRETFARIRRAALGPAATRRHLEDLTGTAR